MFKKYFTAFSIALVLSILMLGAVLLTFSVRYFVVSRQNTLMSVAESAATYTAETYEEYGYVHKARTEEVYGLLGSANDALVVYTDPEGVIRLCSEGADCEHIGTHIDADALAAAAATGEYYESSLRVALISGNSKFIVGVGMPVRLNEDFAAGYVFVFSPMDSVYALIIDIAIVIELASLLSVSVIALAMYFLIRQMIRPLREMSAAAKSFGNGDFSARVTVRGDDEISSLAKVFNKMALDLTEIEETRRNFIANVSHELRTPMTTISGYIDGILDGTIPQAKQREYLETVSEETKRLARMTSSTLAIARMEEGSVVANMEAVNVWNVMCAVMFSVERRISAKNISVPDFEVGEVYALCDSDMLHQIIYNLVDNAVKFTPENGTISVNCTTEGDRARITVRNTGVGIPRSELPFVFERFYKTDKSRAVDKTGSGLGLYIVKSLVQRLKGEITVSSVENEYCEFNVWFTSVAPELPVAKPKENIFSKISKPFKRGKKSEEQK